ncbi:hypothetical protein [Phytohabitans rumicis]|uniref:hypothetical protein n=1 Tax=Phytohabitans rumicis TaxID=1076125 RepID=UPI001FE37025|nr:hypothetical protein [Phytohabitans rumicis]
MLGDVVHVEDPAKYVERQLVAAVAIIGPRHTRGRRRGPIRLHRVTQHGHAVEHHRPP